MVMDHLVMDPHIMEVTKKAVARAEVGKMTAAGDLTKIGAKRLLMNVDMTIGVPIVLGGTTVIITVRKEIGVGTNNKAGNWTNYNKTVKASPAKQSTENNNKKQ